MKPDKRSLVVNVLSAGRIVGAVLFILLALHESVYLRLGALALLVVLLCTDLLDGHLARRWRVESELGYILDGLGDRALYIAILLVLMEAGLVLATTVFLILFRDLLLYGMRALWADWRNAIASGRIESKLNALWLRIALMIKLSTLYARDVGFTAAHSVPWHLLGWLLISSYVVFSYILLLRYGKRLLHSLFPENQADQGGQ